MLLAYSFLNGPLNCPWHLDTWQAYLLGGRLYREPSLKIICDDLSRRSNPPRQPILEQQIRCRVVAITRTKPLSAIPRLPFGITHADPEAKEAGDATHGHQPLASGARNCIVLHAQRGTPGAGWLSMCGAVIVICAPWRGRKTLPVRA